MKQSKQFVLIIFLVSLIALVLGGCSRDKAKNIQLGKATYEAIWKGDGSAENSIDWESLKYNDQELGTQYKQIPGSFDKAEFRRYTMSKIAADLKSKGWSPGNVRNWRTREFVTFRTIITADAPKGTVNVTISVTPTGQRLVTAIETKI